MAHPMRIDRFLYVGRGCMALVMLESWRQREQFSSFSFSLRVHALSIFFFLFKKGENNKKAIFYMCVYTQTVTAYWARTKERERWHPAHLHPPGGTNPSIFLVLYFSSIEYILWFPSVASCAAQSIKTWPRRKPAALHYIRRSAQHTSFERW